jgi:hypothetical protein
MIIPVWAGFNPSSESGPESQDLDFKWKADILVASYSSLPAMSETTSYEPLFNLQILCGFCYCLSSL